MRRREAFRALWAGEVRVNVDNPGLGAGGGVRVNVDNGTPMGPGRE